MNSPARQPDSGFRRHRLVRVSDAAWRELLATREDLRELPLVPDWVARGWPFIVRRPLPGEHEGIPLGLPLPYWAGKHRVGFVMPEDDIVSTAELPLLADALHIAPPAWRNSLDRLHALALAAGVQVRVFGSLAWQRLTGLEYLHDASDADVVMTLPQRRQLEAFLSSLADIDSDAPMRIDGEFLLEDGAGANWRELHGHVPELALKTQAGVALMSRDVLVRSLA
jgi:phosphoribosyl-dephospho-CoA transferase